MKMEWLNDGKPDAQGRYIAVIVNNEGKEVSRFEGASLGEINERVKQSQVSAEEFLRADRMLDGEAANHVIAYLVHAVHMQHSAIDVLMARLIVADPTFRPSQSGPIWDAVKDGQNALHEWSHWVKTGESTGAGGGTGGTLKGDG